MINNYIIHKYISKVYIVYIRHSSLYIYYVRVIFLKLPHKYKFCESFERDG